MENIYLKNPKIFSIYLAIPEALTIYNNKIHSNKKYKPVVLFKTTDKKIINEAAKNIKKSHKKFKNNINYIKKIQNVYYVLIL